MSAPDTLEQLTLTARRIWDNAKLYPQDGRIVVLIDHADWTALGNALERVTPRKTHRSVILRAAQPGSGEPNPPGTLTTPDPGSATGGDV